MLHQEKKRKQMTLKTILFEWILINRSLGVLVSLSEVIIKACNLNQDLKKSWSTQEIEKVLEEVSNYILNRNSCEPETPRFLSKKIR